MDHLNEAGVAVDAPLPVAWLDADTIVIPEYLLEAFEDAGDVSVHGDPIASRELAVKFFAPTSPDDVSFMLEAYYHANVWYPWLDAGVTIESVLLPLSPTEVAAVVRGEDAEAFSSVVARLQDGADRLVGPGNPWFLRLNSVSPKHRRPFVDARAALHVIRETPRTCETLKRQPLPSAPLTEHTFMIRRWRADMAERVELRCVIHQGTIRAISQYDANMVDGSLTGPGEKGSTPRSMDDWRVVKRDVVAFLRSLLKQVDYHDCVADVAVCRKEGGWDCLLVEFNTPVYLLAGSGLFSAVRDADILWGNTLDEDIYNARTLPVFRYLPEDSRETYVEI